MKPLQFFSSIALFTFFSIAFAFGEVKPDPQSVWHTKIGDIDFYCIQDAPLEFENDSLLTDDQETLNRLAPNGKSPGSFNLFVVQKGTSTVLIDTGIGGKMLEHLQSLGIDPGDVKDILLTHSHGDHVGGLIKAGQKNFPNAVIWLDPREIEFWKSAKNHDLWEQCLKLYGEPKLLTPDEKMTVVFPEMIAVDLAGHTPGHTGFLISSGEAKLLLVGDLLHSGAVQFARPDINFQYDNNPEQAGAVRKKTLQRAADEKLLFAASHLPFPSVGYVKTDGEAFRFEPAAIKPVPGKQVAQTAELPANTVVRPKLTEEQRKAEKARREALTPEQRDSEDRERRFKSFEEMKHPKPLSETEKQTISYWLFLPNDYKPEPGKKWPLLLFLHGSGERGEDINKVKVHGPPKLLDDPEKASDWPFITVSPQCPEENSWSPLQLGKLIDELESRYEIDKDRVYVTGLSMGGFGTWGLLYQFPDRFAAGAPVCGGFDPSASERFVNIPLWVFHGAKDNTVKVTMSTDMVDAIKNHGGTNVQLTVYPDLEHDSWTVTYDNPELYTWLLKQSLKQHNNSI